MKVPSLASIAIFLVLQISQTQATTREPSNPSKCVALTVRLKNIAEDAKQATVAEPDFKGLAPHQILGVREKPTLADVKKAYRLAVQRYHPDRNPGSDGTAFRAIQKAYETLLDTLNSKPTNPWGRDPTNGSLAIEIEELFSQRNYTELLTRVKNGYRNIMRWEEVIIENLLRTPSSPELDQFISSLIDIGDLRFNLKVVPHFFKVRGALQDIGAAKHYIATVEDENFASGFIRDWKEADILREEEFLLKTVEKGREGVGWGIVHHLGEQAGWQHKRSDPRTAKLIEKTIMLLPPDASNLLFAIVDFARNTYLKENTKLIDLCVHRLLEDELKYVIWPGRARQIENSRYTQMIPELLLLRADETYLRKFVDEWNTAWTSKEDLPLRELARKALEIDDCAKRQALFLANMSQNTNDYFAANKALFSTGNCK